MQQILLLGAGYGMLSFIKHLPQSTLTNAQFTLITQEREHCEKILLHEVASGYRSDDILHPLERILPREISIVYDSVRSICSRTKSVRCANGTHTYDTLIIGLGFRSDSFNIPGVEQYALSLSTYEQARAIYGTITRNLERYKQTRDERYKRIIVCGGGFSGCELVASLAQELPKLAASQGISEQIELVCIEALPHILPMFSHKLAQKGRAYLQKLGISVRESSKILACEEDGIIVQTLESNDTNASTHQSARQEKISSFCVIWTAGVQGSSVIADSFITQKSKLQVTPFLQPTALESKDSTQDTTTLDSSDMDSSSAESSADSIYVLGDCGALLDPSTNRFHAPTAQIAIAQGAYLAHTLSRTLSSQDSATSSAPQPFSYTPQGTICSLGSRYAIGEVGGREISGLLAIAVKRASEWRWRRVLKR